jgi:hypothetical protein
MKLFYGIIARKGDVNMMHNKRYLIYFGVGVIFSLILWNSPLVAEYRAFRAIVSRRTSIYDDNEYKDKLLLGTVEFDGVEFYIFEADEYINDVLNAKVYSIVQCNQEFLFFKTYDYYLFTYEGTSGVDLQRSSNGTTMFGVKEVNNFDKIELMLEDGETKIIDVTSTKVLFYYSKEYLDIESYQKIID